MKSLFFSVFFLFANTVGAEASLALNDPSILGKYVLETENPNSEVQTAEIVFNNDNRLVVRFPDRTDAEYELSGPDKDGVIVDFQDEPNCGGEEDFCGYDSQITVKLAAADGKTGPKITAEITVSNAWDDEGTDSYTDTYVLAWAETLPYQIPFYLNVETPAALQKIAEECRLALDTINYEDETSYLGYQDVCPSAASFQYRDDLDTAFSYFIGDWSWNKKDEAKVLATKDIRAVFQEAKDLAAKYKGDESGVTSADIVAQIEKIETYAISGDKVIGYRSMQGWDLFVFDTETKIFSLVNIQTSTQYFEDGE